MALLRQCLQALRTKNGGHEAVAGAWMPSTRQQLQRGARARHSEPGPRVGDAPASVTRRLPAV